MTVAELIKKLEACEPTDIVAVWDETLKDWSAGVAVRNPEAPYVYIDRFRKW